MKRFLLLSAVVASLSLPWSVLAAGLSVSSSRATVNAGDNLALTVSVDSAGTAINAAEGRLIFPSDMFSVVSIAQTGSIFSLWITAPAYDGNSSIAFNGGLPSPGYSGSAGTLFRVTLRAEKAGSATFSLTDAAVRANDGLGTDVLSVTRDANITVSSAPQTTSPTPGSALVTQTASNKVSVSSPTHPSPDAWYRSPDAQLEFTLPPGATAVQTLLTKAQNERPAILYATPIQEKLVTNIEDGVWYFNIRAKAVGNWTDTTSFRIQIDTTPPTLTADISYNPDKHALELAATSSDKMSGVASYALLLDGATSTIYTPTNQIVEVPVRMQAGEHAATLRVMDNAGNIADVGAAFLVPQTNNPIAEKGEYLTRLAAQAVIPHALLILCILLLLSNIALWYQLLTHRRPGAYDLMHVQTAAKQRMRSLKNHLSKYSKRLEHIQHKKKLDPKTSESLKKTQTIVSETETILDEKLKALEKLRSKTTEK